MSVGCGNVGPVDTGKRCAVENGEAGGVEAEVWELIDRDDELDDDVALLVAASLLGEEALFGQLGTDPPELIKPESASDGNGTPMRAFLRSIAVEGFRGIGPKATLNVNPYPGVTVICGRNGSGKSSFAEAFEYALTGTTYRWSDRRAAHWRESWRNLHKTDSCAVSVEFALVRDSASSAERAKLTVGAEWGPQDGLEEAQRWSQVHGNKRTGVGALGWTVPLEVHRPMLSYEEVGSVFEEGPTVLYDRINRLLALDELNAAEDRLRAVIAQQKEFRRLAGKKRVTLRKLLEEVEDPRARIVLDGTKRVPYRLDEIVAAIGTESPQAQQIEQLRSIARISIPAPDVIVGVAGGLRQAGLAMTETSDTLDNLLAERSQLLEAALELHPHPMAELCPVCGVGTLDEGWRVRTTEAVEANRKLMDERMDARRRLSDARHRAKELTDHLPRPPRVEGDLLEALPGYLEAVERARALPEYDGDWPGHLETTMLDVAAAAEELIARANERVEELEDAWAPVAAEIRSWVELERLARNSDAGLRRLEQAQTWLRSASGTLRARRLEPIVGQAREIWAHLRQESNVDLGAISLKGAERKRHVALEGVVDGEPAGALSVMSQGELHALALALFIPRATSVGSPFRFLILDDPIQAMDPAKIEGFLEVLLELGKTRQVVVFSHDDRLPTAIRNSSLPAQILEVRRGAGSVVEVEQADTPAERYAKDAVALVKDRALALEVKGRALPGLYRLAIEAAARQRWFTVRAMAGFAPEESEQIWDSQKRTQPRVALAVHGVADASIGGWRRTRAHRDRALSFCTGAVHLGTDDISTAGILALRHTINDILAGS